MGCSSSQPNASCAPKIQRADRSYNASEDFDWPKFLCEPQGTSTRCDRSSASSFSSEQSPSPSKTPIANECSPSKTPEPLRRTSKISTDTSEDRRRISKVSTETSTSFSRRSSKASTASDASDASYFRLEELEVKDAREIQVSIFSGVLIALADAGNPQFGVEALPCNPKDTLHRCRRAVKAMGTAGISSFALAAAISSVLSILQSFKAALVDAGAGKLKTYHVCHVLASLKDESFKSTSLQSLVNGRDIRPSMEHLQKVFAERRWDEFGYGVGALAWLIAQDIPRTREYYT